LASSFYLEVLFHYNKGESVMDQDTIAENIHFMFNKLLNEHITTLYRIKERFENNESIEDLSDKCQYLEARIAELQGAIEE